MKFTLKNRPEIKTRIPCLTDFMRHDQKMDEWFEGFEKELREMHLIACGYEQRVTQSVVRAVLKEILGE